MSDLYEHDATTNTLPFLARSGAPDEGGDIRVSSLGSRCALHHLCVHGGLDPADLDKLNAVSRGIRSTRRGQALYRMGDAFRNPMLYGRLVQVRGHAP